MNLCFSFLQLQPVSPCIGVSIETRVVGRTYKPYFPTAHITSSIDCVISYLVNVNFLSCNRIRFGSRVGMLNVCTDSLVSNSIEPGFTYSLQL
jgi:hypothetical protein